MVYPYLVQSYHGYLKHFLYEKVSSHKYLVILKLFCNLHKKVMKKVFIYVLKDPLNFEIRYVGKTVNVKRRYYQHCSFGQDKEKSYRKSWLLSIKKLGLKPILEILEECDLHNWSEKEQFWISYFKNIGCKLVNHTKGGDGFLRSEETRQKMSIVKKGKTWKWKKAAYFSEEHRKNISKSLKGNLNIKGKKHKNSWFEKTCIKIINLETNEIYLGYKNAAISLKIPTSTLYRWLKNPKINKTKLRYYDSQI